jgi:thiol-disulfide isomerase/thioredoxin
MRRAAAAASTAVLLALLTACAGSHQAHDPGNTSLQVKSPDLVALKKQSDVPDCPRVTSDRVSGGMPAVTLDCLGGGRSVDVAGLRGPMIVNFWASWCGGCRQEMPALAAYAAHQSAVKVLGVDFLDPQPAAALQLARRSSVGYPLVADPGGALDDAAPLPHVPGLPMTVFLDSRGAIVHVEAGVLESERDVAAAARKYLGTAG